MAVKEISQKPNKKLRIKSTEIENIEEAKKIIKDLEDTLENSKVPGAGLSAPQIGINKRIFIARKYFIENEIEKYTTIHFINPHIIKMSSKKEKSLEGCLSIKDTYGYVNRSKSVRIKFTNKEGTTETINTGGFLAKVIQHENDHLDGILFTDKLIDNKKYTEQEIDALLSQES